MDYTMFKMATAENTQTNKQNTTASTTAPANPAQSAPQNNTSEGSLFSSFKKRMADKIGSPEYQKQSQIVRAGVNRVLGRVPTQEELKGLSDQDIEGINKVPLGGDYAKGFLVDPDLFKRPLAEGETYEDRVKSIKDNLRGAHSSNWSDYFSKMNPRNWGSNEGNKQHIEAFNRWREGNPEEYRRWVDSIATAFERADPKAIESLQKSGLGSANGGTLRLLPKEDQDLILSAGKKAVWNGVKSNPLKNLPLAIGMWLRQSGHGKLADFASDPLYFYGSLIALLGGGGLLLSSLGGGGSEPQQIVINNGQPQQSNYELGMSKVPYS